jgi:DNA modification methylase
MARLCAHLKYRWTLAYLTPGGQAVQQWPVKVNTTWKPVLLFGESVDWFGDTATSKLNDKRYHHWGQSESGMADLIERLTKPGQLVCDPFLGGGTTAVVSLATGRRFVGCDIDESAVLKTRERVEAQLCQM